MIIDNYLRLLLCSIENIICNAKFSSIDEPAGQISMQIVNFDDIIVTFY